MKKRAVLLVGAMALALVMIGGVALADDVFCRSDPCRGTQEDDAIFGANETETIRALGGRDFVDAWLGDDTVYGGDDSDNTTFEYPDGPVLKGLVGAEGSDTVYGEDGNDYIDLFTLDEEGSEDSAFGGTGNDTIDAFDENKDTINCGKGDRDKVYYDRRLDVVSNNCEIKRPNEAPPAPTATAAKAAATDVDPSQLPSRSSEEMTSRPSQ
jgi:RTX calcium-binding nonapeptide repeat (4 copies)